MKFGALSNKKNNKKLISGYTKIRKRERERDW